MQIALPYMMGGNPATQDIYAKAMAAQRAEQAQTKEQRLEKIRHQQIKRDQERQKQQQQLAMKQQAAAADQPRAKPLIDESVAYSAISYFNATNPNGRKFHSELYINHAPNMTRYENRKKLHERINIFRYDKGVIWSVHREDKKRYAGVKLYQEFKLKKGLGLTSHIDNLMHMRHALLSPKDLKDMGQETVDGHETTHYYKRDTPPYGGFNDYHYWINGRGIVVRMKVETSGKVGYTIENKNITLAKQAGDLFVIPAGYKKAGHHIDWRKEKEKLDAGN
jgi:hypothetical protein